MTRRRDRELNPTTKNAVKIDEYTDGTAYSTYESVEEYLEQQLKENAAAMLTTKAVRLYGAKRCKNGNICLYGKDVISDAFVLYFVSVPTMKAISPEGLITVEVLKDDDGVPTGLDIAETDKVLTDKVKDLRLVLVDDKPVQIKK